MGNKQNKQKKNSEPSANIVDDAEIGDAAAQLGIPIMETKQNKPSEASTNIVDGAETGDAAVQLRTPIMGNKQNKPSEASIANFFNAAKTGDIEVRSVAGNKEHAVYFMILKQLCFSADRTLYYF